MIAFTVVLWFACVVCGERPPVVRTPLGELSGYYMHTREGRKIAAFTSIPYAVPPIGELRFKAPVPIEAWEGTLNATSATPPCVQRNPYIRQQDIVGQEDCLYLNIYTPVTENELGKGKTLPVVFFIHGGGWMCGDSSESNYGPQFLLDRDVLLVTTNYRLGPLGFLSTMDKHCPGNNGLKDQQEALRFVQKTIESFGGDKNSVTIFGESAGGASVHYHMLSKTSVGLFHKAIGESGTAMVPWAESAPGEATAAAFKLARFLDCPQSPSKKMLECLRKKDSYDIIGTEFKFYAWDYDPMTPFKSVAEPDLPGAFITKSPRTITDVPAVPWITGLNRDEGCLKAGWITQNPTRLEEFLEGFHTISPYSMYYTNSPLLNEVNDKIYEKYIKNSKNLQQLDAGIISMYSDSFFGYPAVEAIQHTFTYTKNPVYLYNLVYEANNSFAQIFGYGDNFKGVCHADELMHLFPIWFLKNDFSKEDIEMSKLIVTLWTNFATSGDPNKPIKIPFKWYPATSGHKRQYLEIGSDSKMQENLAAESTFWGTLPLWHNFRKHVTYRDEL